MEELKTGKLGTPKLGTNLPAQLYPDEKQKVAHPLGEGADVRHVPAQPETDAAPALPKGDDQ
jgi:hypothetical protein